MSVYVFRIDYDDGYDFIKSEILEGRLRQGWGAEGLDARNTPEQFSEAFSKKWDASQSYITRKYNRLHLMTNMEFGDLIVIPKLNLDTPRGDHTLWDKFFTVVKVTGKYDFDSVSPMGSDWDDFRHVIKVEPIASFSYDYNNYTRTIKSSFGGYRDPVNNVNKEEFHEALRALLADYEKDPDKPRDENMSSLEAIAMSDKIASARSKYLASIAEQIKTWDNKELERIIIELFAKNGYECIRTNSFDGKGGDVDAAFACYTLNSLLEKIVDMPSAENVMLPEIRVQAKKKSGTDFNDIQGILQLFEKEGSEKAINILINTADDFTPEAKREAQIKGVIIINGQELAELLVQYGLTFAEC